MRGNERTRERAGKWSRAPWGRLGAICLLAGCATRPAYPPETLPGPETLGLAARWRGVIIRDEPVGGIIALELPSLTERTIRAPDAIRPAVRMLAGPDREGWIAYTDHWDYDLNAERYSLRFRAIRLDGTGDHLLFSRRLPMGSFNAMGDHMALSPGGRHIAFISDYTGVQMTQPDAWLTSGTLEIWDTTKSTGGPVGITARDGALSWFPDGRRLAYATLAPRGEAGDLAAADGFGAAWEHWPRVPAVHILDLKTGKGVFLCVGDDPVVSQDGESVMVRDYDARMRIVDAATGRWKPVKLPGQAWSYTKSVVAFQGDSVLYWAVPTVGAPLRTTKDNSPLVGPKWMLTLKTADLKTGRYQTIMEGLDPRRDVDYGVPAATLPSD
jgi:hypothetical protein